MAQSVAVAVGKVGDELVNKLSKKVEALKVGPGSDKSSEMGPLVTKEHLEKVKGYVDLGDKEGAKLVVDGPVRSGAARSSSHFFHLDRAIIISHFCYYLRPSNHC